MDFDGEIILKESAMSWISHEGRVITECVNMNVRNFCDSDFSYGKLAIEFATEHLPLGNSYTLHLGAGSIGQVGNMNVTLLFTLPQTLLR